MAVDPREHLRVLLDENLDTNAYNSGMDFRPIIATGWNRDIPRDNHLTISNDFETSQGLGFQHKEHYSRRRMRLSYTTTDETRPWIVEQAVRNICGDNNVYPTASGRIPETGTYAEANINFLEWAGCTEYWDNMYRLDMFVIMHYQMSFS
jgi:hypothetical protein